MMKTILLILTNMVLLSGSAMAFTNKSYVELSAGKSSGDATSRNLSLSLALGKHISLTANRYVSKSDNDGSDYEVKDTELGFKVRPNKNFSFWASGLKGKETGDITYAGLSGGASYKISEWWKGDLPTTANLSSETMKFEQTTRVNSGRDVKTTFNQNRVTAGISHYLSESFNIYGSYSKYNYSVSPEDLSKFLEQRPLIFNNTDNLLDTLPDQSMSVGLIWIPLDELDFDFSYSRTKQAIDQTNVNTYKVAPTAYFGAFSIGASYSKTKEESQSDSESFGLSLGFEF